QPIPFLALFDAPEPTQSNGSRATTTVAPQALAMMNSPFVRQAAEKLAVRVHPKTPQQLGQSLDDVYRIALARRPTAAERRTMQAFLTKQAVGYGKTDQALHRALADFCHVILCLHEFAYVD